MPHSLRALRALRAIALAAGAVALIVAAAPAAAQNLTTNPGFDGGFAGWTDLEQDNVVETEWLPEDATGNLGSGSVRVDYDALTTGILAGFHQCVAVSGDTTYQVSARTRVPAGQDALGAARVDLRWSDSANCGDTLLSTIGVFNNSPGGWVLGQSSVVSPAAASSVLVQLRVEKTAVPDEDLDADFDDVMLTSTGSGGGGDCVPTSQVLCIDDQANDGRFRVRGSFQTTQGGGGAGAAQVIPLKPLGVSRGGLLWFFRQQNPEVLVKVLDGCIVNGHYWVFYAAVTNVGFTLRVDDTQQDLTWVRTNVDGTPAAPVQDTEAFPCS